MLCPLCGCRPCHCAPVPSPAVQDAGGVGYQPYDDALRAWLAMSEEERDRCRVEMSRATIRAGEPVTPEPPLSATPAIEPTGAADVLATPKAGATPAELLASPLVGLIKAGEQPAGWAEMMEELGCEPVEPHPLEVRRDALVLRLLAAGFVEAKAVSIHLRKFVCYAHTALIPDGHPREVEEDFRDALDYAEKECVKVEDAKQARQGDAMDPIAPGPTLAEVQEQLRDAQLQIAGITQILDAAGIPTEHVGSALKAWGRVGLVVGQWRDMRKAITEITAALDADPERSPAWDDNDQPIPLPRRVEVALMPEGPGNTWIERKIMGHLDSYGVPTERNGITLTLASRVAVAAEAWRDHSPDAVEVS